MPQLIAWGSTPAFSANRAAPTSRSSGRQLACRVTTQTKNSVSQGAVGKAFDQVGHMDFKPLRLNLIGSDNSSSQFVQRSFEEIQDDGVIQRLVTIFMPRK